MSHLAPLAATLLAATVGTPLEAPRPLDLPDAGCTDEVPRSPGLPDAGVTDEVLAEEPAEDDTDAAVEPMAPAGHSPAPGPGEARTFGAPAAAHAYGLHSPDPGAHHPRSGLRLTPLLHLVGEYGARFPSAARRSNAFSLPRAHGGLEVRLGAARGRLLLDAAHATAGGALLGVSGDSLVVRVREAWAGYRRRTLGTTIEARLGVVPSLLSPAMERAWQHRALGAVALERFQLASPTDFGLSLQLELPWRLGWAGVAVTNGEGYTARELNLGKNVEAALALHPLRATHLRRLVVLAGTTLGSSGLPESATVRYGGGVLWDGARLGLGITAFGFRGLLADANHSGYALEGFARATLIRHVLLAGRVQYLRRSLEARDDALDALVGAGLRVRGLDVFAAYSHVWLRGATWAALPGGAGGQLRLLASFKLPEGPKSQDSRAR